MSEFKKYSRVAIAEMREVTAEDIINFYRNHCIESGEDYDVSISDVDTKNGSPKIGDMIARNPKDHNDQWLIAKEYFLENFKKLT